MIHDGDFLIFVSTFTLMAGAPGPGMAALVASVLAHGARRSVWFGAGMVLGDLVWLTLSLSGLALIAGRFPVVFDLIRWAGVAYLLYLAWKIWRAPAEMPPTDARPADKQAMTRLLAGLSMTMGNPKVAVFYLALLPTIISPDSVTLARVAAIAVMIVCLLSMLIALYMLAANGVRKLMRDHQSVRNVNRVTAFVLAMAALWIALR